MNWLIAGPGEKHGDDDKIDGSDAHGDSLPWGEPREGPCDGTVSVCTRDCQPRCDSAPNQNTFRALSPHFLRGRLNPAAVPQGDRTRAVSRGSTRLALR